MLPFAGLWRAVLKRSRADWPVLLAAWLLLVSATTLLAAGTLYPDTVALGGLRRAVLAAPPADRALSVRTYVAPEDLPATGPAIAAEVERALRAAGGEVARVERTGTFAEAGAEAGEVRDLTVIGSYERIAEHATILEGRWASSRAADEPIEATLSEGAARELDLGIGDRVRLVSRLGPPTTVELALVGVWRPEPTDSYWLGDPLELDGVAPGDPFTIRGPFVVAEADLLARVANGDLDVWWRSEPAVGGLHPDRLEELRRDLEGLPLRLAPVVDSDRRPTVATGLPAILEGVGRSILVSRSGVLLLTIQFAVIAGYAILLVAGMLVDRRRPEVALLRSRGATSAHLAAMAFGEALLVAVPATALAPFLAVLIVRLLGTAGPLADAELVGAGGIGPTVLGVSLAAGAASAVALTLPALASGTSVSGVRAAIGRQAATTLPQRLGIDLALVVLAGVGLWQLRLYGAPLTRDARGTLGIDPLLVAAPGIGLLAGAIVAIRVVPRAAEIAERLLGRRRGFVLPLGARQLARRPLRYTRSALLLMLAAALGTFAAAHAATWTRSQSDQAAYQAASDIRAVPPDYTDIPAWGAGSAYRGLAGVLAAMPVTREVLDVGRAVRGGTIVGLDPETAVAVARLPDDEPGLGDLLAGLRSARPSPPVVPIAGEPEALVVVLDSGLDPVEGFGPIPAGSGGIDVAISVRDADGRLGRFEAPDPALLSASGQRIRVPMRADVAGLGLTPAFPIELQGIELRLEVPEGIAVEGSVRVAGVAATAGATGESPLAFDPSVPGWGWTLNEFGQPERHVPPVGTPAGAIVFEDRAGAAPPIYGSGGGGPPVSARLWASDDAADTVPAIAGSSFLDQAGAAVGDTLAARAHGVPISLRIIGAVATFPSLDPGEPFVIVDTTTLEGIRFGPTGYGIAPEEWWLDVEPAQAAEVAATLAREPYRSAEIIERGELTRSLTSDPVPLGLIGALGLGSIAAIAFAAIGFVVSATVSTHERIGEFALLQALGLSGRQMAAWLSAENAFLLVLGLAAGVGLGLVLAWLVLPFATLTATGAAPVPAPVVVVPWDAIAPIGVATAVLLIVTVALVTRQVPGARLSRVLRARDE